MKLINTITALGLPFLVACTGNTIGQINPDPESAALQRYYFNAQQQLKASNRMKTSLNPRDATFTRRDLVRNFVRIALFDEYVQEKNGFSQTETLSQIKKWEQPIRMRVIFGESVPKSQKTRDLKQVTKFTKRMATITGLNIQITDTGQYNYTVLFLDRSEQRDFANVLSDHFGLKGSPLVNAISNSPRDTFCSAFTVSNKANSGRYEAAIVIIKAEQTGLMRTSCIHEEMSQAMGLGNDSFEVRPSIFNDDEEYALMTKHDEVLLRMLYDPRIKAGMSLKEVLPIIPKTIDNAVKFVKPRNYAG